MGTNGSKGANVTCSWTPWGWWWPVGSKPPMCRTDVWGRGCLPAYNPASRGHSPHAQTACPEVKLLKHPLNWIAQEEDLSLLSDLPENDSNYGRILFPEVRFQGGGQ